MKGVGDVNAQQPMQIIVSLIRLNIPPLTLLIGLVQRLDCGLLWWQITFKVTLCNRVVILIILRRQRLLVPSLLENFSKKRFVMAFPNLTLMWPAKCERKVSHFPVISVSEIWVPFKEFSLTSEWPWISFSWSKLLLQKDGPHSSE